MFLIIREMGVRIELTYSAFAGPCLTTWRSHQYDDYIGRYFRIGQEICEKFQALQRYPTAWTVASWEESAPISVSFLRSWAMAWSRVRVVP